MDNLSISAFCAGELIHYIDQHPVVEHTYKILICGGEDEVRICLGHIEAKLGKTILDHLIIATDKVSPFIQQYFLRTRLKVVDWNEAPYEEYLISRVLSGESSPIRMAIDFNPTLRRLHRLFKIVDKHSLIIIKEEGVCWRSIFPALFAAFEENGTTLLKVDECLAGSLPTHFSIADSEYNIPYHCP